MNQKELMIKYLDTISDDNGCVELYDKELNYFGNIVTNGYSQRMPDFKEVRGECAINRNSIKPIVGKEYVLIVGDPMELKATYVGRFDPFCAYTFNLNNKYKDLSSAPMMLDDILVFRQGNNYIFLDSYRTAVIRRTLRGLFKWKI